MVNPCDVAGNAQEEKEEMAGPSERHNGHSCHTFRRLKKLAARKWRLRWTTVTSAIEAMHSFRLKRLLRVYCSGHTRDRENEQADWLPSKSYPTNGLQLGRMAPLRGLTNFPSNYTPVHHSIYHLKERGEEKGGGRYSALDVGNDQHFYSPHTPTSATGTD